MTDAQWHLLEAAEHYEASATKVEVQKYLVALASLQRLTRTGSSSRVEDGFTLAKVSTPGSDRD